MASTSISYEISKVDNSLPSICIPRVFNNISRERIHHVFELLDFGAIDRVDMIERDTGNGNTSKQVFIHFSSWGTNEQAVTVRSRLLNGKDVKIVYDAPWFWKISASRFPKQMRRIQSPAVAVTLSRQSSPTYECPYTGEPRKGRPPLHRNTGKRNKLDDRSVNLEEGEIDA